MLLSPINYSQLVNWNSSLNTNLVAWWRILPNWRGGGIWYDLLNANNGILVNMDPSIDWVLTSRRGNFGALDFDGSNDRVSVSGLSRLVGTSNTVSFWLNWRVADTNGVVILGTNTTNLCYWQFLDVLKTIIICGSAQITHNLTLNDSVWRYYTLVANGSTTQVYINGLLIASGGAPASVVGGSKSFLIGDWVGTPGAGWRLNGQLDDLRIHNRALSSYEVYQLYIDSIQGCPKTLNRINNFAFLTSKKISVAGGTTFQKDYNFGEIFNININNQGQENVKFPINLSISKNSNALIGENFNTRLSELTNISAQINKSYNINFNLNKNTNSLINKNFSDNFNFSKNLNALIGPEFNINFNNLLNSIGLENRTFNINTSLNKNIQALINNNLNIILNINKNTNALIGQNLDTNLNIFSNLQGLLNRKFSIDLNLNKNINANLNKRLGFNFNLLKNTSGQINKNFPINLSLLYDLLSQGVALKDYVFAFNLSLLKNNIGLIGKNPLLDLDGNKNTAAQLNKLFSLDFDLLYDLLNNNITLKDYNFLVSLNLLKNLNALIGENVGLNLNTSKNNVAASNKLFNIDIDLLYDILSSNVALKDFTFPINISLIRNLLSLKNVNFNLDMDIFLNKMGLQNATFPVTIGLIQSTAKNLLKSFDFPLIIGISLDIDTGEEQVVIVDIDGVDNDFWCIIKRVNIYTKVDNINTSIKQPNCININTDVDAMNINMKHPNWINIDIRKI